MPLQGIVYILTNKNNTTLYTGVTRNLKRRMAEHKLHINKGFSDRYNTEKLVYYEVYDLLVDGIHREKQLKKWHREWKEKLISEFNPTWEDLSDSIGLTEEYIQSVKEEYENGYYIEGFSKTLIQIGHIANPISGLEDAIHFGCISDKTKVEDYVLKQETNRKRNSLYNCRL